MKHKWTIPQPVTESKQLAAIAMAVYLKITVGGDGDAWKQELGLWNAEQKEPLTTEEIVSAIAVANKRRLGRPPSTTEATPGFKVTELERWGKEGALWQATVKIKGESTKLGFVDASTLASQRRMRVRIMNATKFYPPPIHNDLWQELLTAWLAASVDVDTPDNASKEGALRDMIYDWLSDVAVEGKVEKQELLNEIPWRVDNGVVWFTAVALTNQIHNRKLGGWSRRSLWAVLNRYGGQHAAPRIHGKQVRIWGVVPETLVPGANVIPLHEGIDTDEPVKTRPVVAQTG